ncbi:hypothetical protein K9K85_01190 [Patescibacteria group bacterium]|nr:hypothetical protein [Patescibacteria group bacterium]
MTNKSIDIKNKIIVKTGLPKEISLEGIKTEKAYQLSRECGMFKIPKTILIDKEKGILITTYIKNIKPLSNLLNSKQGEMEKLIKMAGRSLGVIHKNLTLSSKNAIEFSNFFDTDKEDPCAFLHGDFNLNNLQYDLSYNLIILDWDITPVVGQGINHGPIYWDIFCFVNAIFVSPPYSNIFSKRRHYLKRKKMADLFISSYEQNSKTKLKKSSIKKYADMINSIFSNQSRSKHKLHYHLLEESNRENFKKYFTELTK